MLRNSSDWCLFEIMCCVFILKFYFSRTQATERMYDFISIGTQQFDIRPYKYRAEGDTIELVPKDLFTPLTLDSLRYLLVKDVSIFVFPFLFTLK